MSQVRVWNTKQKEKRKQTSIEEEKRNQKRKRVIGPKQKKHEQNKKTKFKKLSVVRYIILKIKIRFIFSLTHFLF
jgi:cytoskeletal protein RodZ